MLNTQEAKSTFDAAKPLGRQCPMRRRDFLVATRSYSDLIDPIIERMRLVRGETGDELEALMPQIRQRAGAEAKQKGGPALVNFEAEEKVFASYVPRPDSLLEQLSRLDKDLDRAANLSTEKLRELAGRHGIILGERPA